MAPAYKLTYFNVKALGEPIRFLLSYGGLEFEDIRVDSESWAKMKPNAPFGQIPILEVDGKTIWQSVAICRYIAKKVGLAGSNEWESLQIDAVIDTITDFCKKIQNYHYDNDKESKEKKKEPLFKETVPFFIPKFEDMVKKQGGYFVNAKLTWADVYFVALLEYLNFMIGHDLLDGYPSLMKLRENVVEIPRIKEWIKKRPVTN